ncbi:WxL domain-containing protein, partial [Enterococcus faecalis]|uniref:WxL domain-containing protein n=1 Tax=Enterococcus faecalis TaxID=1351 RepID=UPI003CC6491F
AKVTIAGGNDDPVKPVDPDDQDNPVIPVHPDERDNHGTVDNGPLSIDYVYNICFGTQQISRDSQQYSALNDEPQVQITEKPGVEG